MRYLQKFGWLIVALSSLMLIGILWADLAFVSSNNGILEALRSVRGASTVFIQFLWVVMVVGGVAMGLDRYWGRWLVQIASLLILGDMIRYEVIPELSGGTPYAWAAISTTWPAVIMGRGPIAFLLVCGIFFTVSFKGLARRPGRRPFGAPPLTQ